MTSGFKGEGSHLCDCCATECLFNSDTRWRGGSNAAANSTPVSVCAALSVPVRLTVAGPPGEFAAGTVEGCS